MGFTLIARSPYLLLLCSFLLMTNVVGSLIWLQRTLLVAELVEAPNDRTSLFAKVSSASAVIIAVLQLLATGRLLRWLGLRASLSSMPLVCGASIALMLWRPTITTVALAELSRKIVGYALVRPAREVLYTCVSKEEKYRAKPIIDAVVHRAGDLIAAGCFELLDVQLELGEEGVAAAGGALCAVWVVCAVWLGTQHARLERLRLTKS